jgi:uncharacterized protein YbbK (DUF523 family)
MNILVSACLLGAYCRYDGQCAEDARVMELSKEHTLIPVCPEIYGGLPTPRLPGEIRDGRVYDQSGLDVTEPYARGARAALEFAKLAAGYAVLKSEPVLRLGKIYDGTFSGKLAPATAVAAWWADRNPSVTRGQANEIV